MKRVALAMNRYRPHVLLGENGPLADSLIEHDVPVEVIPAGEELSGLARGPMPFGQALRTTRAGGSYIALQRELLADLQPDLVYTIGLDSALLSGTAARLAGVRVVTHIREPVAAPLSALSASASRTALRSLAVIATAGTSMTRMTLPRGIPTCVVPDPIGTVESVFPPTLHAVGELTFAVVGVASDIRRREQFLRVFARAFPRDRHRALIIGNVRGDDGCQASDLAQELQRSGRLTFGGGLDAPAAASAGCQVLVDYSGVPAVTNRVVGEALAVGMAVVRAAPGATDDLIVSGINGLLFTNDRDDELIAALRKIGGDSSERQRLGSAARLGAQRLFPRQVAAHVERVFDCAVRGQRGALHVVVNGRFQGRPISGVERLASNVSSRLSLPTRVVKPPRGLTARGVVGHLWEQAALPLYLSRSALLWNPCNFGPLLVRRSVVTVHDIGPIDHPEWFGTRYRQMFSMAVPRLCHRVMAVTTVSSYTRRRLIDRLGVDPVRVSVVPNGWEIPATVPMGGEPDRAPYVLVLGGGDPRKNLAMIRRAVALTRERQPNLRLRVTGDTSGVFAARSSDLSPLDIDCGHVSDEELLGLYVGAECLVYASSYEGFGLPPLEAMALGTRVVASRLPSVEEVCGDAAVYVDPDNSADIARGIDQVLSEPVDARRRAIDLGHERAASLTWDAAARAYDELFAALLGLD